MGSEGALETTQFELFDCRDLKEEEEVKVEYNAELQAKYPCPESLNFVKHLLHTEINVIGSNSLCLFNGGMENTGFRTRKHAENTC